MKTAKLLLVENNLLLARLLPLQLTKHGYEIVAVAKSGEEAIIKAAQHPLDLVLMDIDLDGMVDGIAAAAGIQAAQDVPVIFTTSHADAEIQRRVQAAGPVTCLLKPFTEKEISIAIEFNLYRHRAERERARLEAELRRLKDQLLP